MSVYSELMDEWGFDPTAPGPVIPDWQPWTLRGTWEILLRREDMTVWTRDNVRQLNQLLSQESSPEGEWVAWSTVKERLNGDL